MSINIYLYISSNLELPRKSICDMYICPEGIPTLTHTRLHLNTGTLESELLLATELMLVIEVGILTRLYSRARIVGSPKRRFPLRGN